MWQKYFDNKAHLTPIWKTILQLPSFFNRVSRHPVRASISLNRHGLVKALLWVYTELSPSHWFKRAVRKLNITYMASKETRKKKVLPGLLKRPPTPHMHNLFWRSIFVLSGCWDHAWHNLTYEGQRCPVPKNQTASKDKWRIITNVWMILKSHENNRDFNSAKHFYPWTICLFSHSSSHQASSVCLQHSHHHKN